MVGVIAVGGTTTGTWESPPFTYDGADGKEATTVSLALDRRADVDQLLAVDGNSAEYTVRLVDLSEGREASTLIPATTLAGANAWTEVSRGSIDPEVSRRPRVPDPDHEQLHSGTSVLVTGSADYDNVVLRGIRRRRSAKAKAKAAAAAAVLERAAAGGAAAPGDAGHGGPRRQRQASLRPGQVPAKDRPRLPDHGAGTAAQGAARRPASARSSLRSGKSRLVVLPVKPKARKQVAKRKRLLVRQKVRAGKVTATVVKSRRRIRR